MTDHATGQPLPGTTIRLLETGEALTADPIGNGRFQLCPGSNHIEVRLMGYRPETRPVQVRAGQPQHLAVSYAGYFFGFVCLGVLVSAWASSSRNALLALLTLWITFVIILPKTMVALGDSFYPLPSMQAYHQAIDHDVDEGLPGGHHQSRPGRPANPGLPSALSGRFGAAAAAERGMGSGPGRRGIPG